MHFTKPPDALIVVELLIAVYANGAITVGNQHGPPVDLPTSDKVSAIKYWAQLNRRFAVAEIPPWETVVPLNVSNAAWSRGLVVLADRRIDIACSDCGGHGELILFTSRDRCPACSGSGRTIDPAYAGFLPREAVLFPASGSSGS